MATQKFCSDIKPSTPTPESIVLVSACNSDGDYASCWGPLGLSLFQNLITDNTELYGFLNTERHYMFKGKRTHDHVHFHWPLNVGKVTQSGSQGSRVYHCMWGSSVNYQDSGFLSLSFYERCTIPNITESCVRRDITRFFENWSSESDEENRKEAESDDEIDTFA